jgi:hypothetical protein
LATEHSIEIARRILPYLVRAARVRETPTYGQLAQQAGCHHRAIPPALYYIKEDICTARHLPPLTAIVLNGTTKLPGPGFLPEGTGPLSDTEYLRAFEVARDRVFAYQRWDTLLSELGLPRVH